MSYRDDSWPGPWYWRPLRRQRLLVLLTGQLANLVRMNVPFGDGLTAFAAEAPDWQLRWLLLALRKHLDAGLQLHEAIRMFPRFFPRYYADIIESGEETGRLADALDELEEELLRTMAFREKLIGHAIYVFGVLGINLMLIAGVGVFVLPTFAKISEELPGKSTLLLNTVTSFSGHAEIWLTIGFLFICSFLIARGMFTLTSGRGPLGEVLGKVFLSVPWLRTLIVKRNLAHVSAVVGRLLAAGVPLDAALADAESLDIHPWYAKLMGRMRDRIMQGESLTAAVGRERHLLPASFRGLVSLGERSGLLPQTLGRIAYFYRLETLRSSRLLVDILAPATLCFVGALVFLVFFTCMTSILSWDAAVIDAGMRH